MTTTTGEQQFRQAEQQLDSALAAAAPALAAQGVDIADHSQRTLHYKNARRRWEMAFSRTWDVGLTTAQVTLALSLCEALDASAPLLLDIALRAQLYRSGQASSVDVRKQASIGLEKLSATGIAAIVFACLEEGAGYVGVPTGSFNRQG